MKQQISQSLYAYWNDVRGTRMAPKRFEIEPSCLADILPDTFILERNNGETSRFRLAGTRICEAFGTEFRGSNFFELFSAQDRVTLQRQFSIMARQGAAGLFNIDTETGRAMPRASKCWFCRFFIPRIPSIAFLARWHQNEQSFGSVKSLSSNSVLPPTNSSGPMDRPRAWPKTGTINRRSCHTFAPPALSGPTAAISGSTTAALRHRRMTAKRRRPDCTGSV